MIDDFETSASAEITELMPTRAVSTCLGLAAG